MRNRQLYLSLVILLVTFFQFLLPSFFAYLESLRLFPNHVPMVSSTSLALVPLRLLNAFVFLWFAFDNFESPIQFSNIGNLFLRKLGFPTPIPLLSVSYAMGVLELLVAIFMLTGSFLDLAGLLGSILVFAVVFAFKVGNGTLLVRDLGVLGACLSLLWLTV